MKYIRTKSGIARVIMEDEEECTVYYGNGKKVGIVPKESVIKEADTIEDLIMHDDLVEHDGLNYSRIERVVDDHFIGYDSRVIKKDRITALYIAQGEDVDKWEFVARSDKDWELELVYENH